MKTAKLREEIKAADSGQLSEMLGHINRQLLALQVGAATNPVKDCSQFGKLRRTVARILTELRQRGEDKNQTDPVGRGDSQ